MDRGGEIIAKRPEFLSQLVVEEPGKVYSWRVKEPVKEPVRESESIRIRMKRAAVVDENPVRKEAKKRGKEIQRYVGLASQIKDDQNLTNRLKNRINLYDDVHKMKSVFIGMEFQDNYITPFSNRLKENFTGENYTKFLSEKRSAIEKADTDPVPIRSNRPLTSIPVIRVSKKGLKDPNNKYREKMMKEKRLTDIVNSVKGIQPEIKKQEQILNHEQIDINQHTRFFYGTDENANKYGRRAYDEIMRSSIMERISMF